MGIFRNVISGTNNIVSNCIVGGSNVSMSTTNGKTVVKMNGKTYNTFRKCKYCK